MNPNEKLPISRESLEVLWMLAYNVASADRAVLRYLDPPKDDDWEAQFDRLQRAVSEVTDLLYPEPTP